MRWRWMIALVACTPHGAVPERAAEPEPAPRAEAERPRPSAAGCDHDAPAWLTVDVDGVLPPLPNAPIGPGIPPSEREPRKHPEVWGDLVRNVELAPAVPETACRSQHFLEGNRRPVATILYTRGADTLTLREDSGTDGRIDETRTWTRDAAGSIAEFHRRRPARRVCGQKVPAEHEIRRYVYDRFGMHVRTDIDHEGDGHVDLVMDWRAIRYDRDGLPILVAQFDGSGQVRVVQRFTWGADGRLTERLVQDPTGKLLEAERHHYDAHGQKRWQSEYRDGSGWRTTQLHYGPSGELVGAAVDVDADCFADERTLMEYDARGELLRSTTRVGDEVTTEDEYVYDDAGRLLRFSRSRGVTRNDELAEHTYDAGGRVTSRRVRERRGRPPQAYVYEDHASMRYDEEGRLREEQLARGTFGPAETVVWTHACKGRYARFPALDPRDDPELARYCFKDFE